MLFRSQFQGPLDSIDLQVIVEDTVITKNIGAASSSFHQLGSLKVPGTRFCSHSSSRFCLHQQIAILATHSSSSAPCGAKLCLRAVTNFLNSAASSARPSADVRSVDAKRPCLTAFRRDQALPLSVFNPVDSCAFLRFASRFFAEVALRYLSSCIVDLRIG